MDERLKFIAHLLDGQKMAYSKENLLEHMRESVAACNTHNASSSSGIVKDLEG